MKNFDVISSGTRKVWGFLCLVRNSTAGRSLFKKVSNWQEIFENIHNQQFDESHFSRLFVKHKNWYPVLRKLYSHIHPTMKLACLEDAWSNPGWQYGWINGDKEYPTEWYWRNGILTNNLDNRKFSYLHFIHWKSEQWCFVKNKQLLTHTGDIGSSWIINEGGFHLSSD